MGKPEGERGAPQGAPSIHPPIAWLKSTSMAPGADRWLGGRHTHRKLRCVDPPRRVGGAQRDLVAAGARHVVAEDGQRRSGAPGAGGAAQTFERSPVVVPVDFAPLEPLAACPSGPLRALDRYAHEG